MVQRGFVISRLADWRLSAVPITHTWLDLDLTVGIPHRPDGAYRMEGHCTNCGTRPLHGIFVKGTLATDQGECPACGCCALHWVRLAAEQMLINLDEPRDAPGDVIMRGQLITEHAAVVADDTRDEAPQLVVNVHVGATR
jgi:hypothetical protein